MTKLINISAQFASKSYYLDNNPSLVTFSYFDDGKPLNAKDSVKIEKITAFYLQNDLYPDLYHTEPMTDNNPVEALGLVDLNLWSNQGLPKFNILDEDGIAIDGLPNAKGGRKQSALIGV